jgi:hypothetical protein
MDFLTNLVGNVRVRITLASPDVLVSSASPQAVATGATYSLSDMYVTVDTIDIQDGSYYQMHDSFLSQGGIYELPFKSYYSFASSVPTGAGALKFSLSTASLNMLWATFVNGSAGTPQLLNGEAATSTYFKRDGDGVTGWQFNVNNNYFPQYRANNLEAYQLMLNSYNMSQDTLGGTHRLIDTQTKWLDDFWVAVVNFAHPCDMDTERYISGQDTRGNVAQGFFEYAGLSTAGTGLIFAETTAILQVGAGRQLQLVA